ncbi:transporter [Pseudomonas sp. GCM10022188]|uniref:SphA family protein n=1 Tax=Pseudomonas TaxID=286 RepID=UPI001E3A7BC5|nr:transporter [Pseudomonas oryzagri]MCC6073957.1 transporter [Pseudomonas oryzagri]
MHNNNRHPGLPLWLVAALAGAGQACWATEGRGSSYPMGAENYMSGALPPPGWYAQVYAEHYTAEDLKDDDGHSLPVDFRLRASVIAPRLVWVTEQKLFGGDLALQTIAPLVDLSVTVNGDRDHRQGLGDMIFGPALGYHYSDQFHAVYALDIIAPTGEYERGRQANIGRHYWAVEPVAAFSYVDPAGPNLDLKLMYDFNARNSATDYRSGREAHADYALGWGLDNGWVVGVGGYVYRQVSGDDQSGAQVDDNKGRAFAIGPSLKYSSPSGWFLTAKWQQESAVRNRPEGDAYWLKLTMPL